jgi:hypothetical protein
VQATQARGAREIHGALVRETEIERVVDFWKKLGANPTPLPYAEQYSALSTGLIDALEADVFSIKGFKWGEQATKANIHDTSIPAYLVEAHLGLGQIEKAKSLVANDEKCANDFFLLIGHGPGHIHHVNNYRDTLWLVHFLPAAILLVLADRNDHRHIGVICFAGDLTAHGPFEGALEMPQRLRGLTIRHPPQSTVRQHSQRRFHLIHRHIGKYNSGRISCGHPYGLSRDHGRDESLH